MEVTEPTSVLISSAVLIIFIVLHNHLIALPVTASPQLREKVSKMLSSVCITETSRFTHHTKQSMVAVCDIGAHGKQQECDGPIHAFGFTLSKVLVSNERALLVANEATKWYILEWPVCQMSIHLAHRDKTWQIQFPYAKNLQPSRPAQAKVQSRRVPVPETTCVILMDPGTPVGGFCSFGHIYRCWNRACTRSSFLASLAPFFCHFKSFHSLPWFTLIYIHFPSI